MKAAANPYLNFDGNTEEAFTFYRSVFGGDFIGGVRRFEDLGGNDMGLPEDELKRVAHVALPLGGGTLMGSDILPSLGHRLTVGNNTYVSLEADSEGEADRLFAALAEGGEVEMPIQRAPWAEKYGICADRFGVQWMMSYPGDARDAG